MINSGIHDAISRGGSVPTLNNALKNALVTIQPSVYLGSGQVEHILRNVCCLVTLAEDKQRTVMLLSQPLV